MSLERKTASDQARGEQEDQESNMNTLPYRCYQLSATEPISRLAEEEIDMQEFSRSGNTQVSLSAYFQPDAKS